MKVIYRKEAKNLGLTKYFTGKACCHGHTTERYVSTYQCVKCMKERKVKHIKRGLVRTVNNYNWENVNYTEAYDNDLLFYSGKICVTCTNTKRYTNNSECVHCSSVRASSEERKDYLLKYNADEDNKLKSKLRSYNYNNGPDRESILSKKTFYGNSYANYESYGNSLTIEESPRSDSGILEVKCTKCRKYFKPKQMHVNKRVQCLKGNYQGESRLYCSEKCKSACSIYNKQGSLNIIINKRPLQTYWANLVKERDDNICQICGIQEDTMMAHHIEPVSINPIESADIDNGITLCRKCHKQVHKLPECSYNELRCR